MRGIVVAAAAALALAAPAVAAAPTNAQLARQIRVLQTQNQALARRVAALERESVSQRDHTVCYYAFAHDSFVGLFHTVALIVELLTDSPPPADPARFDDQGACQRVGITR